MDQLESDISELEFNITHTLDYSDMEEALDNPPPMEMERVEEQKQGEKEVDSTFIRDMGLDKEQEMEPVDCSFPDPVYQELEESLTSRGGE